MSDRVKLLAALEMPSPSNDVIGLDAFDPWEHVIKGIHGGYARDCDDLMIEALEAVRDGKPFEFMDRRGLAGELALYILSGHGLTEYGTSPRGAWPDPDVTDLWNQLIAKWKEYAAYVWGGHGEQVRTDAG